MTASKAGLALLAVLPSACIVRAQYYPIYADADVPPRRERHAEIPVYQSTEQLGRAYYIIGLVETRGNAYARWGSHRRKLQDVARERNGDAVIVFSSSSELISIYSSASTDSYANTYSYGIPIRGLTTGAAIIRFTDIDLAEGGVSPVMRVLMRELEVDQPSIQSFPAEDLQMAAWDSLAWENGTPRAEYEFRTGEQVDAKMCRVAALAAELAITLAYQKAAARRPESVDALVACGTMKGRIETSPGRLDLRLFGENGVLIWQKSLGVSE